MACPLSALHLPLFLLPFLLLLPLTLSSSSSLTHLSASPKVVYLDPMVFHSAQREYKTQDGRTFNRVVRGTQYQAYNSSAGGGGGVVRKLLDGDDGKSSGDPHLSVSDGWDVAFQPDHVDRLEEEDEVTVTLWTRLAKEDMQFHQIRLLVTEDEWVASVDPSVMELHPSQDDNQSDALMGNLLSWSANFTLKGVFVGFTKIRAVLEPKEGMDVGGSRLNLTSSTFLKVSVIRRNSWMDRAFTVSIAILVSVLFVNFGAALDWEVLRDTIRRPIGPSIGFVTQFLFMPIVSYVLGMLLFDSPSMRLGLFFTGCSPGGGASNIWTFALGGNLPLSITMTTISTFASFGMMPFWLFTLGATIFSSAELSVPYSKIAMFAIALVVPLAVGFLVQRKWPRAANFLVLHVLKPLCGFLLVFIIVFAIATNLYIFHLFSWKIILCGMGLPWMGFAFGAIAARLFSLSSADILAIAIETGIQNTGIAIFMLRFTLGQPLADLTTVIPVSIAVMTPLPLALLWLYKVFTGQIRLRNKCQEATGAQRPLRESTVETINGTMMPLDGKV